MTARDLDQFDRKILRELQLDSSRTQRELAERVGLSQNAVWRRLKALEESGVIKGYGARIDRDKADASFLAFALVRTRDHSGAWLRRFRDRVTSIPDVIGFYRISGDYDYLLMIGTKDVAAYDRIYQRLIDDMHLEVVTSYVAMEVIAENRPLVIRS